MYDEQGINGVLSKIRDKGKQLSNWVREQVKDVTGLDVLTATKAPQRLAFLGLVRINALGMADFFNAPNNPKLTVEEQNKIIYLGKDNLLKFDLHPFKIEYQSSLTSIMIEKILANKKPGLPKIDLSLNLHKAFIKKLLIEFNKSSNMKNTNLPIT